MSRPAPACGGNPSGRIARSAPRRLPWPALCSLSVAETGHTDATSNREPHWPWSSPRSGTTSPPSTVASGPGSTATPQPAGRITHPAGRRGFAPLPFDASPCLTRPEILTQPESDVSAACPMPRRTTAFVRRPGTADRYAEGHVSIEAGCGETKRAVGRVAIGLNSHSHSLGSPEQSYEAQSSMASGVLVLFPAAAPDLA